MIRLNLTKLNLIVKFAFEPSIRPLSICMIKPVRFFLSKGTVRFFLSNKMERDECVPFAQSWLFFCEILGSTICSQMNVFPHGASC